ncbi:hypothetical protein BDV93DRAFT_484468 [Ceratobasidium sp. AG-I]|nr:hypothetical protein BDV93DRAFT_484468 [Ceratobasidium sp. AG-I]
MESFDKPWKGYDNLETMVIFGDSYSSVLPYITSSTLPSPTHRDPLGVPFPGSVYTDDEDNSNWVGYIVETWTAGKPPLIYNFAQGGDTTLEMKKKVDGPYQKAMQTNCKLGEHWKAANTLFVFWIGINDMGYVREPDGVKPPVETVFKCVQTVYDSGARAFLFIDMPPIERAPLTVRNKEKSLSLAPHFIAWNECMNENVRQFSKDHPDASCFQFSSFKCLSDVLDNPEKHGFTEKDPTKFGGGIWADHIHLTGAVHDIIGKDIRSYMMTI